jgi:flagellar hook-associated protein 2
MNPMVSISGLASGVQWHDLVEQVIAAERMRSVTPLSQQIDANRRRVEAWNTFRSLVSRLETASRALRDGAPFQAFTATAGTSPTSGRGLVTATAAANAVPGVNSVEVQQLARSEKLATNGFATATTALNELDPSFTGGTFTINGREVTIEPGDSLAGIRDRINQANTGSNPSSVVASILTVGPDEHRLILTSVSTGAAGVQVQGGENGVLSRLGIATGARSAAFSDSASPLASLLGLTSPPEVRTIVVEGREVTVDLATDSLQTLLDKVRAAAAAAGQDPDDAGRLVVDGGSTRLEVRGSVVGRADDAETRVILDALGFSREGLAVAGTNAALRIDGFDLTRSTNTVADAIPGVTLSLQGAEAGTVVELAIDRDTDAISDAVKEFAAAYNEVLRFVNNARGQDSPLAANSTLRSVMSNFTNAILTPVSGLETAFERAAQIGLSLSRSGILEVDEQRLRSALEVHPADVQALFAGRTGEVPVQGLAARMFSAATVVTQVGDGRVAIQLESLDRSTATLNRRMADAEARLELRRETMMRQFARMESALSTLQAQGDWLASQLQALQPRQQR